MSELSDQDQTRLAVANLAAAFAKTLDLSSPGFGEAFLGNLDKLYLVAREAERPLTSVMETLTWTRQLYRDLK